MKRDSAKHRDSERQNTIDMNRKAQFQTVMYITADEKVIQRAVYGTNLMRFHSGYQSGTDISFYFLSFCISDRQKLCNIHKM